MNSSDKAMVIVVCSFLLMGTIIVSFNLMTDYYTTKAAMENGYIQVDGQWVKEMENN